MPDETNISTLASNIQKGVKNILKDVHTALPAIVENFDKETQLAEVQPAIKRIFIERKENKEVLTPVDIPKLINVPVVFPRGGGFTMSFPVKKGDECLLIFSERSIDNWYETGENKEPIAKRFHDYTDAIALIGLYSKPNLIPDYDDENVVIKFDDNSASVTIKDDGNVEIKADTKILLDTPIVEATNDVLVKGKLTVEGDTELSDVVTSNGKDISDTHTHSGSPTAPTGGVSNTGAPT